jgi:hypothetical protein
VLPKETLNGSFTVMVLVNETFILPYVLYGCETWFLTLREENRLEVFENGVLRISGLKREEVTEGLRELHNRASNEGR